MFREVRDLQGDGVGVGSKLWEARTCPEKGGGGDTHVGLKGPEVAFGGLSSLRGRSEPALWGQGRSGAPQLALEGKGWLYVCMRQL